MATTLSNIYSGTQPTAFANKIGRTQPLIGGSGRPQRRLSGTPTSFNMRPRWSRLPSA
jgi:hypothetical protein